MRGSRGAIIIPEFSSSPRLEDGHGINITIANFQKMKGEGGKESSSPVPSKEAVPNKPQEGGQGKENGKEEVPGKHKEGGVGAAGWQGEQQGQGGQGQGRWGQGGCPPSAHHHFSPHHPSNPGPGCGCQQPSSKAASQLSSSPQQESPPPLSTCQSQLGSGTGGGGMVRDTAGGGGAGALPLSLEPATKPATESLLLRACH